MARKNASNLDNQISLLDMMVSESPEYSEEKPKENQEISKNAKNDAEQTAEISGGNQLVMNYEQAQELFGIKFRRWLGIFNL